jgi:hypothetical protein
MTNTVLIKRSSVANSVPLAGNLQPGELAINYNDGNLFYKNTSNVVTVVASSKFVSVSGNVTGGNIITSGAVSTSGIVSTGTVDFVSSGNISLGSVGNVHISGGTANYVLSTDGSGNLSWVAQSSGGYAAGNSTQVQFNTSGNLDASGAFTFNSSSNVLSVAGNISGTYFIGNGSLLTGIAGSYSNADVSAYLASGTNSANIITTGNISSGNLSVNGLITASGNILTGGMLSAVGNAIVGGNIIANVGNGYIFGNIAYSIGLESYSGNIGGNYVSVTGNIDTIGLISALGNISTAGSISATGNITSGANLSSGNIQTAGLITATGNVTGGNVRTAGLITATGNITGANFRTAGLITATGNITGNSYINSYGFSGSRSNTEITTGTTIDTFYTTAFRGAKYLVSGGDGTDYQTSDVLLVHDGASAYITISTVCSNASSDMFSVSASVAAGNVVLSATKISTGTTTVNLVVTYVGN